MADRDELLERLVSLVPGRAVEPAAFAALAAVGRTLPEQHCLRLAKNGLIAASGLHGQRPVERRMRAETALAPILPPELADRTLEFIGSNTHSVLWPPIVTGLEALVPHLTADRLPRAFEVFLDTPMVGGSDLARLPRLLTYLGRDDPTRAIRRVFKHRSESSTEPRNWWLWELQPYLSEELANEAFDVAQAIGEDYDRRALLAAVLGCLPGELRTVAARQVLDLIDIKPNHPKMRVKILAPLVAAIDTDEVTAACQKLLTSLDPRNIVEIWDDFSDLLRHLPVGLVDLALDFGTRVLLDYRYRVMRALAPRMPTSLRADMAHEVASHRPNTMMGVEMTEHARALIALSAGLPDEEQILAPLLEWMTRRNWWDVYESAFVELIPRLAGAARDRAVMTALHQCFGNYRIEEPDRLLAVLNADGLAQALTELSSIRDKHARAAVLAALMRRAGAIAETPPEFGDVDLLGQITDGCTQAEAFAVIAASAWWFERNGGTATSSAVADVVLDIVQR